MHCIWLPNSPHDLVLLLLLLLLSHKDILDLHPLVGREVRQVRHFVHGSGVAMSFGGIVVVVEVCFRVALAGLISRSVINFA